MYVSGARLLSLLTLIVLLTLLVNCAPTKFSSNSEDEVASTGDPVNPPPVDPPPVKEVLKTLQPTLAVRGISCLLCHADIRSNVVTDFGHGNSWYMGGANAHLYNTQTWYNNLANAWQSTSNINGSIYVPKAEITRSAQAALGANYTNAPLLSIKEMFAIPYTTTWNGYLSNAAVNKAMDFKITPPAGQDKVIELAQVVIRAPDESVIDGLTGDSMPFVNAGAYFTNDSSQVLECEDTDIVVKGTLVLRNLRVKAAGGCRIYVTKSVFIQGAITYEGTGDNPNLQITSANAIMIGMNATHIKNRVINDARGAQLGWSTKTFAERAAQVVAESNAAGTILADAMDVSPRASHNYTGLLLNAPMVHSRYLGNIQGTVVAEIALFAVGQFHFVFDPVFTKVDVFPLLIQPIIEAKN